MGREEIRFKSFSERVASIHIDVIHRAPKVARFGSSDSTETHFKQTLDKWRELDCTNEFAEFTDLLGSDVYSLPQLLHAKDGIFRLLQDCLGRKQSASLEAFLELLVALALDLQDDFYSQFEIFFRIITSTHLQERDADVLEKVFTNLAYLFKLQRRLLVKDVNSLFNLYKPLFCANQKDYIIAFAAESFAFVLRKVPDKPMLLKMIFEHVDRYDGFARGFGALLFEMLKGVKTRLHSCSEELFPLIVTQLAVSSKFNGETGVLFETTDARLSVVTTLLELLCQHLAPEHSIFIWKTFEDQSLLQERFSASYFAALCQCYRTVVSFQTGYLIVDPNGLCTIFSNFFRLCPKEAFGHLLESSANVLWVCEYRNAAESSVIEVLDAFCQSGQVATVQDLFEFVEALSKLKCFQKRAIPRLWKYCERLDPRSALRVLSQLEFLAATKINCGADLHLWKPIPSVTHLHHSSITSMIMTSIDLSSKNLNEPENLELFWESCCVVRHCHKLWSLSNVLARLNKSAVLLVEKNSISSLELICIQECVKSIVALGGNINPVLILSLIKRFKHPMVLRSMDLVLERATTAEIIAIKDELVDEIWWVLSSPYAIMRFLSLRILLHTDAAKWSLTNESCVSFQYMLDIEGILLTIHDFKDKTNMLSKLSCERVMGSQVHPRMLECILAFFYGQLYINFSQLWSTVENLIVSFSSFDQFWVILDRQFEETTAIIHKEDCKDNFSILPDISNALLRNLISNRETSENADANLHRLFLWNIIEKIPDAAVISEVPYKYFISIYDDEFKPISEFVLSENVCSTRSHAIPDSYNVSETDEPSEKTREDFSEKFNSEGDQIVIDLVSEDEFSDVADLNSTEPGNSRLILASSKSLKCTHDQTERYGIKRNRGANDIYSCRLIKCIKVALSALSKSKLARISSVTKRKDLEDRFSELLMYPEPAMQRASLQCLFACDVAVLRKCREHLLKLLDDKQWTQALNDYFLSKDDNVRDHGQQDFHEKDSENDSHDSCSLSDSERKEALRYVMRLLFGRMLTKRTGKSKSRVASRHAAVLRFLASSRELELSYFIELILLPIRKHGLLKDAAKDLISGHVFDEKGRKSAVNKIAHSVIFDPSSAIPVRRLRRLLSNIGHILNHMAGVLPSFLPLLLHAVLIILCYTNIVTDRAAEVNRLYVQSIRKVRLMCVDIVFFYFSRLNHFAMVLEEVHLFFEQYAWHALGELVRNPSDPKARVFRLVTCFSSTERFQFLLGLRSRQDPTRTILTDLMTIMGTSSAHTAVINAIKSSVQDLLSDLPCDPEAVPIKYCLKSDVELDDNTEPSLCFRLVLPYTYVILRRPLERIRQTGKPLDRVDRFILFKLSKYNTDAALASSMLALIIPSLVKRSTGNFLSNTHNPLETSEDASTYEYESLSIINNLVKLAESIEDVFIDLSRLWSVVEDRAGRGIMVKLFGTVSSRLSGLDKTVCVILQKVNSWDARLAEEPDYLQRIKGFKDLVIFIESMKIPDTYSALPLIHNCLYASLHSRDLSLRDAATHALFKVIAFCNDLLGEGHESFFKICVEQEIYVCVRKGLRCPVETTRHECVKIISYILDTCGQRKAFEELKSFHDPDKEKDYFECITHVQFHRRARALSRLTSILDMRRVSHRLVLDIFLPLTESFLLKDEYEKQNVNDAAISNLGALAKQLPWRNYVRLLNKYIKLLNNKELCAVRGNQKSIVKIVVSLLDAFHFDLSQLVSVFDESAMSASSKAALPLTGDTPVSLDVDLYRMMDNSDNEDGGVHLEHNSSASANECLAPDNLSDKAVTVVDAKLGREILLTLKEMLLSRLQATIVRKNYCSTDDENSEEHDVLRVPIAVAIVKLLSLLPSPTFLQRNLPSVFLRVVVFLKSRLLQVRNTARSALVKIIQILGPCYLRYMVREMRLLLTKGFQLHVLSFSVHAVLEAIRSDIQPGDLDGNVGEDGCCIGDILAICLEEQFGTISEEKEVASIAAKTDEARKQKSLDMFRILAEVVSTSDNLERIIGAVSEYLLQTSSAKTVAKCERIFEQICVGLGANRSLGCEKLFILAYKILSKNTTLLLTTDPALIEDSKNERKGDIAPFQMMPIVEKTYEDQTEKHDEKQGLYFNQEGAMLERSVKRLPYEKSDVFIVPKAPQRGVSVALKSFKTNVHVIVLTAIKVLKNIFKSNSERDLEGLLPMMDPFVAPLAQLQRCSYVKVATFAMSVLQQLMRFPLPAMSEHANLILSASLNLIHKYVGSTQKTGANFDLLIMSFKMVRYVLLEIKDANLSEDQCKLLLTYIETDVCDIEKQGVAFSLLSALIQKRIDSPELHLLMKKVADISIVDRVTAIRSQARAVYQKYLFDYPIQPKLREKCVAFFLGQLEYAVEEGRQSAAEMVNQIIKLYPEALLSKSSLLFFVPLSTRLSNDNSATMRRMCYACLKKLLDKLQPNSRSSLYGLTRKWLLDSSNLNKQAVGAQVIGCFAEVERESFAPRVGELLGIVNGIISSAQANCLKMKTTNAESEDRQCDRLIYLCLNTIVKIFTHVRLFESVHSQHRVLCADLLDSCYSCLLYPHAWVRVAAAQMFGLLFAGQDPEHIAASIRKHSTLSRNDPSTENTGHNGHNHAAYCEQWLQSGGRSRIDELTLTFIEQFQSRQVSQELLDQLVKNLLFIGKVLFYLESNSVAKSESSMIFDCNASDKDDKSVGCKHRTFDWFLSKVEKELRVLGSNPREPNVDKRTCLYKLLAALSLGCPQEALRLHHRRFLRPLVRDMEGSSIQNDSVIGQLLKDVSQVLRRQMGIEFYQEAYAQELTGLARLKAQRKHKRAVIKILNPVLELTRHEIKKEREKNNRKRKLDSRRGRVATKKVSRIEGDEITRVNQQADFDHF